MQGVGQQAFGDAAQSPHSHHICIAAKRQWKQGRGKERKGGERKGKERRGKERKGKERKGKERKGKERKGKWVCMLYSTGLCPYLLLHPRESQPAQQCVAAHDPGASVLRKKGRAGGRQGELVSWGCY